MVADKSGLLAKTIGDDKHLESLSFSCLWTNPAGNEDFLIISGQYRVRATRRAGILELHTIVAETNLSDDAVKAKQLPLANPGPCCGEAIP